MSQLNGQWAILGRIIVAFIITGAIGTSLAVWNNQDVMADNIQDLETAATIHETKQDATEQQMVEVHDAIKDVLGDIKTQLATQNERLASIKEAVDR